MWFQSPIRDSPTSCDSSDKLSEGYDTFQSPIRDSPTSCDFMEGVAFCRATVSIAYPRFPDFVPVAVAAAGPILVVVCSHNIVHDFRVSIDDACLITSCTFDGGDRAA